MGGKRAVPGRGLGHAARSRAAKLGVRAEGDTAVRYYAYKGNEYRIDVSKMMQTKLATGSRRVVIREVLEGFGVAWSFESTRRTSVRSARGRSYSSDMGGRSDQPAMYVQYPNEVSAVLEHRYRAFGAASLAAQQNPKSMEAAEAAVKKLTNAGLRVIFGLNVSDSAVGTEISTETIMTSDDDRKRTGCCPTTVSQQVANEQVTVESSTEVSATSGDGCDKPAGGRRVVVSADEQVTVESSTEVSATSGDDCDKPAGGRRAVVAAVGLQAIKEAAAVGSNTRRAKMRTAIRLASRVSAAEPFLSECLFERVLQSPWPPQEVVTAVRWLRRRGFQCLPEHCRKVALVHGSLTVLRVLLVEAKVDVRSLELLTSLPSAPTASSRGQAVANCVSGNGWVQRCKPAVKMLLARGAVLGGATGTRSKLLKRLEEDAEVLLRARVLAALCKDLPDVLLGRIGDFGDVPAPFAWRVFQWDLKIEHVPHGA